MCVSVRSRTLCEANGSRMLALEASNGRRRTWCDRGRSRAAAQEIDVRAAVDQCPKAALRLID